MTDTDVVIPPHSLWLTAVEEDNRDLNFTLKNHGDNEVKFNLEVETPSNFVTHCTNTGEKSEDCVNQFNFTVNPNRQKPVTFAFQYLGNDHRQDTLEVRILSDKKETKRCFDIVLFEN